MRSQAPLLTSSRRRAGARSPTGRAGRVRLLGVPEAVTATEQWFVRRGLPHFIDDYSATRDVLTRAVPLLLLILVAELVGAGRFSWPLWLDLLAFAGAIALAGCVWVLVNALRGCRPVFGRPQRVGVPEAAVFVLVPGLIRAAFTGRLVSAGVITVVNLVLLAVIYVGTSYAILPMARWGLGRLRVQIGDVTGLVMRALPLLALLVTFLFLTTEVWQTAGVLNGFPYWTAIALFAIVSTGFAASRVPREVSELSAFASWDEVRALVAGTPAAELAAAATGRVASQPLRRRQWGNVGLVVLMSQAIQVVIVSVLIGLFFVILGMLLVPEETTKLWVAGDANVVLSLTIGERTLVVTEELLRVAGFLTAFTALNFTVYLLTDATYRAEFRDEVVGEVRQAFAVRAAYLWARSEEGQRGRLPGSATLPVT